MKLRRVSQVLDLQSELDSTLEIMKINELRTKAKEELQDLLSQKREESRALRFKLANRETKDVRAIREVRKVIARVLTLLTSQK